MIKVNMDKAKVIGHTMRRAAREQEFAPYDAVIMKQIPGAALSEAEAKRQEIREKYTVVQAKIDTASTPEQIKEALGM